MLLAVSVLAQNGADMSGVWQMNKARSKSSSATAWAKVELKGTAFSVILRTFKDDGKEEAFDWHFALDSSESSNRMHGAPMKSHASREGNAVVVRSVTMFGSDALKTVDHWSLSEDGTLLTYEERHQFAAEPEGTSVFVFERRPESAWPASEAAKTAEQAYKNIQILRGISADQLPVVMGTFTSSLGVNCGLCHVAGDFASDAKPAKLTARKMWGMVAGINRDSFGGSAAVTCWTCHRGSVKPEGHPK